MATPEREQKFLTADQEFVLRPAGAQLVEALVALDRLCFGSRAWSWECWWEVVTRPEWTCLVAQRGERLAGAMVLLLWPPVAQLSSLAVHPAFRGQGLGTALLREAVRRAKAARARSLALEVDAKSPAVRLYRREKFGLLRRFWEDGLWRWEMVRRLGRQG